MGFLAGVLAEVNRQEDAAMRADEFMQSLLEKRKDQILPELMGRIADRTEAAAERTARVDAAIGMQFSERAATALELTGQLGFILENITDLKKDLDPSYIGNLTAGLESRIDNDEELAKAVAAGLTGPLESVEDQENAFLRAYQATDQASFDTELANLINYMGGSNSQSIDDKFDITVGKGSIITEPEFKNINNILGTALSPLYGQAFKRDSEGNWFVNTQVTGGREVQNLFNTLSFKIKDLALDPFNKLGTVDAAQLVVEKISPSYGVKATTVEENFEQAFASDDPTAYWETFRTNR